MSRLSIFAGLAIAFSVSVVRSAEPPSRVALTLHAAAESVPASKYRLLPSWFERRPGNAGPMYAKAIIWLGKDGQDDERRKALLNGPLSECTPEATGPLV